MHRAVCQMTTSVVQLATSLFHLIPMSTHANIDRHSKMTTDDFSKFQRSLGPVAGHDDGADVADSESNSLD